MIRNVVFDMGNVLLRWDPLMPCLRHTKGDRALAEKLCRVIFDRPEWGENIDGGVMEENEYAKTLRPLLDSEEEFRLAQAVVEDFHLDSLYPFPPTEKLVDDLLAAGVPLYLLSNAGFRFRSYCYKMRRFADFTGVTVSAEVGMMKPDPAIFRSVAERFGLNPAETLFVDDLLHNCAGAREAGWNAFQFDLSRVGELRKLLGLTEE